MPNRIVNALSVKSPVNKTFIRIGRDNDGGYVVVDDISKNDFLISMGVADDTSFEEQISSRVSGMHLYDNSIEELPAIIDNSTFFKEKINNTSMHIVDRAPKDKDLILKIDIEGYEWEFFSALPFDQMNRFRQIIVEIHWLSNDKNLNARLFPLQVLEKINCTHQIVSLHPNNCAPAVNYKGLIVPTVIELGLLRKTDYEFVDGDSVPKELFMLNNPDFPEIVNYLKI